MPFLTGCDTGLLALIAEEIQGTETPLETVTRLIAERNACTEALVRADAARDALAGYREALGDERAAKTKANMTQVQRFLSACTLLPQVQRPTPFPPLFASLDR